jgi:hypothetical protein
MMTYEPSAGAGKQVRPMSVNDSWQNGLAACLRKSSKVVYILLDLKPQAFEPAQLLIPFPYQISDFKQVS